MTSTGIIGLVVEFVVAIDEARVRFTDDALPISFLKNFCIRRGQGFDNFNSLFMDDLD